jgi:dipeptidyl aminopeptidase/acylaminoacyl peptidase
VKLFHLPVFSLFIFFSIVCSATPSLDDYGNLPTISRVSISPNGERIAYRLTKSDKDDFIVVFSLTDSKIISVANINDIDPSRIQFADNDNLLLTASKHVNWSNYKYDFDAGTIISFNIEKKEAISLLKLGEAFGGNYAVYPGQSINNIIGFNSNRNQVYLAAHVSRTGISYTSINYSLLKTNVDGKGRPKRIYTGDEHVTNYFIDNKEQLLAIEKHNEHSNKHSIKSLVDGKWKTIYEYKANILTHSFLGLSSDFKSIIYFRNDEDDLVYYKLSLIDGKTTLLGNQTIEKDVADILVNDANIVLGMEYAGLSPSYKLFSPEQDQRFKKIVAMFPSQTVTLSDWTEDWKHIVVKVEGDQFVSDFVLFSEGKPPKIIAKSRPSIPKEAVNLTATVTFLARDGLKIPTILTLPLKHMDNLKNLPTVMLPHGGPESQDQLGFDYMAQALASRGYLVVQPQFRGSSGFGRRHLEAGYGEWGKKMQDDLTDAINFLVRKGYTDPKRVCIAGASYGGYAALAGAALTPDVYQCAFSLAGISDLHRMLMDDKRRYGRNSEILPYFTQSILNGEYDKKALRKISPYFHIDKIKIPVMLVHGEDDNVVEFSQSNRMYKALKKASKDVELIKLKDEDHYLREGSTRIQALKAMIGFIDKHIGGR